jgi:hypothetical protein
MSAFDKNVIIDMILSRINECANDFDVHLCRLRIASAIGFGLPNEDAVVLAELLNEKAKSIGVIDTRAIKC